MPIPITIPRLGWNMEEGVFAGWLKRDGDVVKAGESIFSLESDKATQDIECLDSGILRIPPQAPKEGDTLPVGAHTTASDALWAGLPVLTIAGPTFAGRVAASLLTAIGVPELIAQSRDEYRELALRLVRDPAAFEQLAEVAKKSLQP